ncbi:MAG: nucleoside triphosphate pyrophosphohydrolase [Lysobacterales bacterium]|jgi:ATP diphosphatase|nr:MAG: nucleoside triphosphate pyrophosphohydrolase [Xanthomonadales bacterium]
MSAGEAIERLLAVMARLRDPEQGCPWDREQDFRSIAPYTIEEAYEVADAIARGDFAALLEELGDLLLQVVFHARMAEEAGLFGFTEVAQAISEKLIRRHPHVFGDARIASAEEQSRAWEAHKRRERGEADASALAGIAPGLPEWMRAQKLQKRAAEVGFDWQSPQAVLQKLEEELAELKRELERPSDGASRHERLSDELGDLFFVLINLSRHLGVDPGAAIRHANAKFERRFRRMEALARADGRSLAELPLAEQDRYWDRAKAEEAEIAPLGAETEGGASA